MSSFDESLGLLKCIGAVRTKFCDGRTDRTKTVYLLKERLADIHKE